MRPRRTTRLPQRWHARERQQRALPDAEGAAALEQHVIGWLLAAAAMISVMMVMAARATSDSAPGTDGGITLDAGRGRVEAGPAKAGVSLCGDMDTRQLSMRPQSSARQGSSRRSSPQRAFVSATSSRPLIDSATCSAARRRHRMRDRRLRTAFRPAHGRTAPIEGTAGAPGPLRGDRTLPGRGHPRR